MNRLPMAAPTATPMGLRPIATPMALRPIDTLIPVRPLICLIFAIAQLVAHLRHFDMISHTP